MQRARYFSLQVAAMIIVKLMTPPPPPPQPGSVAVADWGRLTGESDDDAAQCGV